MLHFLKTLGKLAFKFLIFVVMEAQGFDLKLVAVLNAGGFSSPSTGTRLSVNLRGFSI